MLVLEVVVVAEAATGAVKVLWNRVWKDILPSLIPQKEKQKQKLQHHASAPVVSAAEAFLVPRVVMVRSSRFSSAIVSYYQKKKSERIGKGDPNEEMIVSFFARTFGYCIFAAHYPHLLITMNRAI
jgi:hypothetical protein